jgi:sugar phosphate isomerase/epimerase
MKLGLAGQLPTLDAATQTLMPADWRSIDVTGLQRVHALGFDGVQLFVNRPLAAEPGEIDRVADAYRQAGVEVCQINGWYEPLCAREDERRAAGVAGAQALVRIGQRVGALSVYLRPGGLNPHGHWFPHPENHSPATFDRLVDSLRAVCTVAEAEGMRLALEGHVLSPLADADTVRAMIEAVGSPALGSNFDPVNFIGCVRAVYDNEHELNLLGEVLGHRFVAAHAKDCRLRDELVVHIEECVPGTGCLNYTLFLQLCQRHCPDGYVIIEHLPDDQALKARDFVLRSAQAIGIEFRRVNSPTDHTD